MAKRGPQSELTDRNWDDEEEHEEAGIFKQASNETMNQRIVKKAKRRGMEETTGKTAFGGFGGLARASVNPGSTAKTVGIKGSTASDSLFKVNFTTGGATSSVDNIESSKNESKENSSYLHGLKSLNESVLAWIKQHVDNNPYIILTPIFKDYESYLSSLVSKKTATNGSSSAFPSSTTAKQTNASDTKSLFTSPLSKNIMPSDDTDSKNKKEEDEKSFKAPAFAFGSTSSNGEGLKFASATTSTSSGFTFGKSSTVSSGFSFAQSSSTAAAARTSTTGTTGFGGFSFGSTSVTSTASSFGNPVFSFGTLAAKSMGSSGPSSGSNSQSHEGGDDDDYVPPKPEVKEIKEDGSLYSKRCKLFYQKEGQWVEKGVGNVHVKPIEESKTQLLIRADTNLGNILLNIMLSSGLPTTRQGKNNVMLVCTPSPPMKEGKDEDQTPIPMLIRVKTGEEADELLSTLEERKALL